jgi:hypothetical protein
MPGVRMKSLEEVYSSTTSTKKLTISELRNIINEEVTLLKEEASPGKVDPSRFPLKLSDAAASAGPKAEKLTTGGAADGSDTDDAVEASPGEVAVKSLKPSQSSMNIEKAVIFAIAALRKVEPFPSGPGGELDAIITSDNHIMDGHHRWIATGMIDPSASVGGYIVEFPAKQMIAALNMITVKLGITAGKSGSGGFDQFNEVGIKAQLKKAVTEGVWSGSAEETQSALEVWTGATGDAAVDAAAVKMAENVAQLTLSVPGGFPERPDMPVISAKKGHLAKAIKLLKSGQVDLNEPYAKEDETEAKEESSRREGDIIIERWKRLAGIL